MTRQHKVTLNDVARRAGVSATTASYILNGRTAQMRISAETERRVRDAVAALGYRPNRNARNLRTATTKTIGVISDFVASGHYGSQMLSGAGAAARAGGHLLVIGESEGDPEVEGLLVEEMLDRQVDGLVYMTLTASEVRVPAALHSRHSRRTVLLNCTDPAAGLHSVLPDDFEGGRTAAKAMIDAGVTERVFVVGRDPNPSAIAGPLRLQGVQARFAEAGLPPAGVVPCDWSVRTTYDTVHAWLSHGSRPAGLICLNDRIAMGAYQALAAHRLHVPRDVSVVSFDGSELAGWLRPELTSVVLPFARLGARAVQRLLEPDAPSADVERLPMPLSAGRSVRVPATTAGAAVRPPRPARASPRAVVAGRSGTVL